MARKVKGDKKKSKKKQALTPEEEKTRMITVLATKCNLKTEDVEEAYDKFHSKYKDGFIKREEYIQSRKVNKILSLNFPPVCPPQSLPASPASVWRCTSVVTVSYKLVSVQKLPPRDTSVMSAVNSERGFN